MTNKEHLAILKRGVVAWNAWRETQPLVYETQHPAGTFITSIDFSDAYLSGINLSGANLQKVHLRGANLDHANLSSANLANAELEKASLRGANLTLANCNGASFREGILTNAILIQAMLRLAHLVYADLSGTDLTGADLRDAKLHFTNCHRALAGNSNFAGARLLGTNLTAIDLSLVKGLETVNHDGPSSVGTDTIYESKARLPEGFLRGCGVPDNLIQYIPSLVGSAEDIQFYSCFISYSSKDEDFARRLHGRMRDSHLRVWFAPEDIQAGKKLHEQIETAIRVYDKVLVVLSAASLQSEWVMTELRKARRAERQSGKRKLFPVRLVDFETLRDWECFDADSGKDLAVELREYFIPDFSNWKNHDQFEAGFAGLLKDLKADSDAV